MKQYAAIDDTVYLWFAGNDTSGSGGDGASPAADVRLAGAAADAAPVYSPTPVLLSHANYPAGAYEIAIAATAGNGFATGNTYAVFCTLAIDSQNPTGFVGSFDTKPVESNPTQLGDSAQSLTDLKDFADTGYDPATHKAQSDLIYIHGTALTETDGQLAAAFTKLFDVATPMLVASEVMRGTDSAALAATWTDARAGYLDNLSAGAVALASGVDLTSIHGAALTETVNGYLAAAFTKLFDVTTPLLVASDVMRGTDGANTTVPDVAGIAAGLHTTTDGKIDTVDANVDAILLDTGTDGVLLAATATSAQLVDDVWDEILTGATHNIATSAGRRVREIGAFAIRGETAQGGTAVTITLDAAASATDGIYNRNLVAIVGGTGTGQTRQIADYVGSTKVATMDREWRVNPDATSEFVITASNVFALVDQGHAQSGTATTITLRTYASSINDTYLCNQVVIIAGTGRGQSRLIGAYNGTTKVATICGDNWVTTPDATSTYVLLPYGTTCTSCIGTDALGLIKSENDDALTDYDPPTRTEATIDKDAIITEVNANETKIDTVDANVDSILLDTDTTIPAQIAALNDISVANIIAGITDGALDLQEMMRIILAFCACKSSGGGTATIKFRDYGDAKDRITATVDITGNRTAITLDGS